MSPASVLLRIDPDRYRVEAERAKAADGPGDGGAGRARRPTSRAARRSRKNQLLSTEELTRSRGENARLDGGGRGDQGRLRASRCRTMRRSEVRPPITGRDQHPHSRHRPVRSHRHCAGDDRGLEPAAPALQGLGGRVAPRARERPRQLRRGAARPARRSPPASTTSAAWPTRRRARSRCWPGSTPARAEARLLRRGDARRRDEAGCARGARRAPSRRASAASSPTWSTTRRRHACGRSGSACARARASSRSSRASRSGEVVVSEGSDRLADGMPVRAGGRRRRRGAAQ